MCSSTTMLYLPFLTKIEGAALFENLRSLSLFMRYRVVRELAFAHTIQKSSFPHQNRRYRVVRELAFAQSVHEVPRCSRSSFAHSIQKSSLPH